MIHKNNDRGNDRGNDNFQTNVEANAISNPSSHEFGQQNTKVSRTLMLSSELKTRIISEINIARQGNYMLKILQNYIINPENKHELVFFIKPEITSPDSGANLNNILELISDCFTRFDVSVDYVSVLGADYLNKHNIIAKHYGVINEISKKGVIAMPDSALTKFKDKFNISADSNNLIGGHQFLEKFDEYTPELLNKQWEQTGNIKLASGVYVSKDKINDIYIVNGFHPYQLYHYITKGNSIVVFVVSSNTDWRTLRDDMVGVTIPMDANKGSMRRTLLDNITNYSLKQVTQSYNCVHLSAGPIEALAEMIRFVSAYESSQCLSPSDTATGQRLINAGITKQNLLLLITNPKVKFHGKIISVFDLTEQDNIETTINKLKQIHFITE